MPDIFSPVILQLKEIGAFNFLFPFLLTSAITYGLLRKSEIFGKSERNVAVNSVISLVFAFMVWAFPIIQGVNVETQLSTFFAQGLLVSLAFMLALMLFGMIVPNPSEALGKIATNQAGLIITVSIMAGVFIFLTSGLFTLIVPQQLITSIPSDVLLGLGVVLLLLFSVFWLTAGGAGETKKAT